MALPVVVLPLVKFLGPIVPFVKIASLGLLKIIFLFIGSFIAPVNTFLLLNVMTVPTVVKIVKHMLALDLVNDTEANQTVQTLEAMLGEVKRKDLTRAQARKVLMSMQKDIIIGIKSSFIDALSWVMNAPFRFQSWLKNWLTKPTRGENKKDDTL